MRKKARNCKVKVDIIRWKTRKTEGYTIVPQWDWIISILAENFNSGRSYLITAVLQIMKIKEQQKMLLQKISQPKVILRFFRPRRNLRRLVDLSVSNHSRFVIEDLNDVSFCREMISSSTGPIYIRYHPRFFVQVGHETTYASIGNKHFFTKRHHQTYQNYEQPCQRSQTSEFQSHFFSV